MIDAHELPNMNLSYYPRPPQQQLEPISGVKRKTYQNRKDIRIKHSTNSKIRQFDTVNNSLMNYDQPDISGSKSRKAATRNFTSVRHPDDTPDDSHENRINETYES